mmetsp:Transcript_21239/g.63938  ORF Transcript_21239/g.63938 Transcript_21239/m.63938 type:complete len:423 (-) Transcript_21239:224-1492(-)
MPRKRFRREPCDCRDCVDPLRSDDPSEVDVRHAAALQDPPPKCLIIFGDGALLPAPPGSHDSFIVSGLADETESMAEGERAYPHLDGLARDGCSGLLALQQPLTAGSNQTMQLDRLAQLFGLDAAARKSCSSPPSLANRYKEMTTTFVSNSKHAVEEAKRVGFQTAQSLAQLVAGRRGAQDALSDLPHPQTGAVAAAELLNLHSQAGGNEEPRPAGGRSGGEEVDGEEEEEEGVVDLLFLHVGPPQGDGIMQAPEPGSSEEYSDAAARLEWVDEVVRHLNSTPRGRDGLLLSVVLGSGGAALPGALLRPGSAQAHSDAQSRYSLPTTAGGAGEEPEAAAVAAGVDHLRPRQSFEVAADATVAVQSSAPLLVVQRLPAAVRVDACQRLSLQQAGSRGGSGAKLAERFMPELAYKLGRAPKYGA